MLSFLYKFELIQIKKQNFTGHADTSLFEHCSEEVAKALLRLTVETCDCSPARVYWNCAPCLQTIQSHLNMLQSDVEDMASGSAPDSLTSSMELPAFPSEHGSDLPADRSPQ
jgi:hypothetical protein